MMLYVGHASVAQHRHENRVVEGFLHSDTFIFKCKKTVSGRTAK